MLDWKILLGKQLLTEATIKLLEFDFHKPGLDRVIARHLAMHPASGRVFKNCGMLVCSTSEGAERNGDLTSFFHYQLSRT